MAKIFAINGSPRKDGNTAKLLKRVLEGAESAGAETSLIHLSELNFTGCLSCFKCKLLNSDGMGRCALKDDLAPILEELLNSDGVVMGSPIYFGAESGLYRNFLERFFFPLLRYTDPVGTAAPKKFDFGFVYTMNVSSEQMVQYGYRDFLEKSHRFPPFLLGSKNVYTLYANDTYQFDDYSRYESSMFDAEHKKRMRETLFASDLEKAFEMGKNLVEKSEF